MNKKGQGISMTYIIIALLALIVLVVIILFFTGGMEKIFGQTKVIGEVSEQQKAVWRGQCRVFCSIGDEGSFCNTVFTAQAEEGKVAQKFKCSTKATKAEGTSLDVDCPSITVCTAENK